MTPQRLLLVFALAFTAACQGGPSAQSTPGTPGAAQRADADATCNISRQGKELNALIKSARDAGPLDDALARRANEIAALATEAGGAAAARDATHEAACRAIALRAHGALLRVPGRADAALAGLSEQSVLGEIACNRTPADNAGARMACDDIVLWRHTIGALQSIDAVRAIGVSLTRPATTTEPAHSPYDTIVPDEAWGRVDRNLEQIQDNFQRSWANVPGRADHKTRVACQFFRTMTDDVFRWRAGAQSAARNLALDRYDPIMLAAADAVGVPQTLPACASGDAASCQKARVIEVQNVCVRLAQQR